MDYQDVNISEIIQKSKLGDNLAYESLLSLFEPIIKKISYKYYSPRSDTSDSHSDIYQESSIALYRAIQDYDQSTNVPFERFLSIVLTRKLNDFIKYSTRKKHRGFNSSVSMDGGYFTSGDVEIPLYSRIPIRERLNDPAEAVTEKIHLNIIVETISSGLTDLECKVFYLYFVEGLKTGEVAKLLNGNLKSIDNAIKRVKLKSLKYKKELLIA